MAGGYVFKEKYMLKKTDRRQFLKAGLITSATALTGGAGLFFPSNWAYAQSAQYPDVTVAHGGDPEAITIAAVQALGGMQRFVKAGDKVVIKPNMSFSSNPARASNTHPAVVKAVAKMCSEAGASRVSVLDNVLNDPSDCLAKSGIAEYCEHIPNVKTNVVKSDRLFREVAVKNGVSIRNMKVVGEVLDADVLIAVPKGKSHSSSGVSLAMKGMMGLIQDRGVFHRNDLHQSIVDMVTVLKPALVVVDGTNILSTGGPGGPGKVIPLNLVIASPDMVAADAQMVALGTWYDRKLQPEQVKHIRLAAERGLGIMDLNKLVIKNINM